MQQKDLTGSLRENLSGLQCAMFDDNNLIGTANRAETMHNHQFQPIIDLNHSQLVE